MISHTMEAHTCGPYIWTRIKHVSLRIPPQSMGSILCQFKVRFSSFTGVRFTLRTWRVCGSSPSGNSIDLDTALDLHTVEFHFTLFKCGKNVLSIHFHVIDILIREEGTPFEEMLTGSWSLTHLGPSFACAQHTSEHGFCQHTSQPQNYLAYLAGSSRSCFCGSFICWNWSAMDNDRCLKACK